MNILNLFAMNYVGAFGFAIVGYIISRLLRRNDVADVLWGLGFIAIGFINYLQLDQVAFRSQVILALVCVWGLRLALHIGLRMRGKPEDARYANWRKEWDKREPVIAFLKVFVLQGAVMGIVALPVSMSIQSSEPLHPVDFLGVCLFVIGFLFEAVSDYELAQFKKDPTQKGRVMDKGLWAFCRHPNYFGEILIWWGFFSFALHAQYGYLAILSPVLITFLLIKVSGVPMLENILKNRGAEYRQYIEKTPALLPFKWTAIKQFGWVVFILIALDYFWLGLFMKSFYLAETKEVARFSGEAWDPILWPAIGVYFFIAIGLQIFVLGRALSKIQAFFQGALLGLCMYAVYDFTNLALVKAWPWQMALVDIVWGAMLCGGAAWIASCCKGCKS